MESKARGRAIRLGGWAALSLTLTTGCGGSNPPPQSAQPAGGVLLAAFGGSGVVTSSPSTGPDRVTALATPTDGSGDIISVGSDESPGVGDSQWRIEKRDVSGGLVSAFGANGVVTSNPGSSADEATAVICDGTHLYIGGYETSGGNRQWRIEKRLLTSGVLDAGFGTSGVIVVAASSATDEIVALARDVNDLYIVGFDESPGAGDVQWSIEKRSLATGTLVNGFGASGVVTSDPSTGVDRPTCITLFGTDLYLGGFDSSPGSRQWRIEKRQASDGALVTGFGTSGVITSDPSVRSDEVRAIAHDSSAFLLIAGWDETAGAGDSQWRIEKRRMSDGGLDAGFGISGVVTSNPSTRQDAPVAIVAGTTQHHLVGFDESPGPGDFQWRIERRQNSDGALVTPFATGGVLTSDPTTGDDRAAAVAPARAPSPVAMYIGGTENGTTNTEWRIEARQP